ncbi:MAG: P1 family peptidase [Microthrixaceae bacterium]
MTALIAVNAFGDVVGHGPANEPWPSLVPPEEDLSPFGGETAPEGTNTTLGLLVTDAALSKTECLLLAQGAHDGYARAITPPHGRVDGDAVVAAATGTVPMAAHDDPRRVAQVELLRWMAVRATHDALVTLADVAPRGPIPWIYDPAT